MSGRRLAPLVAAAAALALAATASASSPVRLRAVDTSAFPQIRATLVAPPGSAAPTLRENGRPVVGYTAVNLGREKAIVLAVDRSQSMTGKPLASAVAAARSLAAAAGARDDVGVVVFGRDAIALTPSSASRSDALAALDGITVDSQSGTALYDAIVVAAARLSHDDRPGRAIVVVTDGADISSNHTLDDAIRAARDAHAAVYTIGIAGPSFTPDALRQLAHDTGGSYRQAPNVAALQGLYASLAHELARTWQLSYLTASRPGTTIDLAAAVPNVGTAHENVKLEGPGSSADSTSPIIPSLAYTPVGTLLVALLSALLVLLACLFVFASQRTSRLRSRIEPHLAPPVERNARARRLSDGAAARRKVADGVERALGDFPHFKRLQAQLERADLPIRAGELVALCGGGALVFGFFAAAAGAATVFVLVAMAIIAGFPIGWVWFKAARRIRKFEEQLPDILITISASLKAGHSFRQGIQSVVEEGAEPTAKEFRRVLTETQLGKPMDDALADLAERVGSKNLTFVINAVTIQRQLGGSLAGLFDMVADTVRQRQQFGRKVKALTAMGRMSAYVLIALPIGLGLLITAMNPTYMAPLYHSGTGQQMLIAGIVMVVVGSLVLRKIVSFRG